MTRTSIARVLFLMSWAARVAIMPLIAHWGLVGVAKLMGAPLDWASDYTAIFSGALGLGCVALFGVFHRDDRVVLRMNRGPDTMFRHSLAVIGVAMASAVGGVWLLIVGSRTAALWAGGLGLLVFALETSAMLTSMYVRALDSRSESGRARGCS